MAIDLAPTAPFPGYSCDGTTITIPIASILGLTAEEADGTTGDWRSIFLSLCMTVTEHYTELATADRPPSFTANNPTKSLLSNWSLPDVFSQTYGYTFFETVTYGLPDVVDEPA